GRCSERLFGLTPSGVRLALRHLLRWVHFRLRLLEIERRLALAVAHAYQRRRSHRVLERIGDHHGNRLAVVVHGEPIAVVVADTFEHAMAAASLVRVRYREGEAALDFEQAKAKVHPPKQMPQGEPDAAWGEPEKALAAAP